jgi:hypothetical protein
MVFEWFLKIYHAYYQFKNWLLTLFVINIEMLDIKHMVFTNSSYGKSLTI